MMQYILGARWLVPVAALGFLQLSDAAGPFAAAQPPRRCADSAFVTGSGVGRIRIGMPLDSVRRICSPVLGTIPNIHGMLVQVGSDTLWVSGSGRVVELIQFTAARFKTVDSLGVGVSVGRFLTVRNLTGGVGDGTDAYAIHSTTGPACGLVFWLDRVTAT